MNEVPSSAIIMTLMTIASAILMVVLIQAWQGTAALGVQADQTAQSMQTQQLADDYDQYNGSTFTGSEVRNFLSIHRNAEETMIVYAADGSELYNSDTEHFDFSTDYSATGHYVITDPGTGETTRNNKYIDPTKSYVCSFEMNANGSIDRIVFSQEG